MKKPNKKQKIEMYEKFLHKINVAVVCGRHDIIQKLVNNADSWSYSHRRGDCISEKEQQKLITKAFWNLCNLE